MLGVLAVTALTAVQRAAAVHPNAMALPDVELVLTKATGRAHDFAEQAAAMQQRVAQQQEKSRAALGAQRATYESKLAQQAGQSYAISANNTAIDNANKALQKSNSGLEAEVKTLQDDNAKMRQSLQTIGSKVDAAKLFLEDSLKVTDDAGATELEVLVPTTPKPTLDHFLAVAGGVAGSDVASLLQLSSPQHLEGPDALVRVLSQSLSDIATAEVEGVAVLKAHFMANFEEGQKHQEALNVSQATLLELQSDVKAHQGKLLQAKAHLEATGKQLRDRLHGLRVFARKIDTAAATTVGTPTAKAKDVPVPAATKPATTGTRTTKAKELAEAKHVPVPVAVKPAPAPTTQAPAHVASVPATPAPPVLATRKQVKPKVMLAEVGTERREASAHGKPSNASMPKPEGRAATPQTASRAVPKPEERNKSPQKVSATRKEQPHLKKHPEPTASVKSASTKPKVPKPSFMGSFFSTLR